jgi:Undecaprenyl-phosphate glucose phosphotransferase
MTYNLSVDGADRVSGSTAAGLRRQNRAAIARAYFAVLAGLTDAAAIIASTLAIGWAYHLIVVGLPPETDNLVQIGMAIALFVTLPNVMRHEYQIGTYLQFAGHARRTFQLWNLAFVAVIVLGFLTKTSMNYSRGTIALLYGGGFLAVIAGRYLLVRAAQIGAKTGLVAARRIFLMGFEDEIMAFATRHQPWNLGMQIVGVQALGRGVDDRSAAEALSEAVRRARASAPDDIFILIGWDRRDIIDLAVDRFLTIPASIHLGADPLLQRFHDLRLSRLGTVASVQVAREPLSYGDVMIKRLLDICASIVALIVLAPMLLVVSIAIRLDSRGPVFFLQRRYGFNQQPFRIVKFRTMSTMDDGAVVRQAAKDDPRITRVGRFLRRWNIDELPQLFNVLRGEMSLVGPRPHALAHDHEYERRIALYARRHNVKPGITGLAQVNGFRGETSTDDKMRGRVEMDLAYIDSWSLWKDIAIIVQTIVSPKAYRNAG